MQDTDKPVDIDTSGPGAEVTLDEPKETLVEESRGYTGDQRRIKT